MKVEQFLVKNGNHVGIVRLHEDWMSCPESCLAAFEGCIVLDVVYTSEVFGKHFWVWHPELPAVPWEVPTPEYSILMYCDADEKTGEKTYRRVEFTPLKEPKWELNP